MTVGLILLVVIRILVVLTKSECLLNGRVPWNVKRLYSLQNDAIVTTVNESLDLSKGRIGKDVLKYGGGLIQEELRNSHHSGTPGKFIMTNAGSLSCKFIMHACLSRYNGNRSQLASLVYEVLKRANELNLSSISFPTLGTGSYHYPTTESALGIKEGICRFVNLHKDISLKKIDIIIYYKDTEIESIFKSSFFGDDDDSNFSENMSRMGYAAALFPETDKSEGNNTTITYGSVTLTVKCGDITKEACGVIVNGIKANMDLHSSGTVCKTLLRQNGTVFQAECSSKIAEINQDGVAITTAGRLPCKNIIHINMDIFSRRLDEGLLKVLEIAEGLITTSIAIPALGTAKKGADISKIKEMILGAVEKFGSKARKLLDIRLVIFQEKMLFDFIGRPQKISTDRHINSTGKDDPLKMVIIYKSAVNGQELIQSFKESFSHIFINNVHDMKYLKNLSAEQIKNLQRKGLEKGILLNFDVDKGRINMQGLKSNAPTILTFVYEKQLDANKTILGKNPGYVWEYKDGDKWERFEPIINAELEMTHKKELNCQYNDSMGRAHLVNFAKGVQYLLDRKGNITDKKMEIRRRDLTKEEPVPDHWVLMDQDENPKLVQLSPKSEEFLAVLNKLPLTSVPMTVLQIQRVQNKALYQQYAVKKREIESRNPPGYEIEKLLYHGTPVSKVDAINHSGFSRNYKSAVAMFGDGVYFAVDPKYSVRYAKKDPVTKEQKMYQVRVLVGESIVTKEGDRALPNKPGKSYPYDSGTDGNGVMYVIFHDAQAYPEYLITFKSL